MARKEGIYFIFDIFNFLFNCDWVMQNENVSAPQIIPVWVILKISFTAVLCCIAWWMKIFFPFRNNGRPNRLNNQERSDNRINYDRNNSANHNRTSPRHHDNSQMSPTPYASRNRGENNNHSHGSSAPQQGHNNLDTNNSSISSRQSDGLPPAQRCVNFSCH